MPCSERIINQTENKTYNVGFSFANEFISDYPNCLYDIKSELNIQAITPCRIYICSSELLLQEFEENKENQRIARIAAEQLFFQSYSRYLDLFRFTSEERYQGEYDHNFPAGCLWTGSFRDGLYNCRFDRYCHFWRRGAYCEGR